MKITLNPYDLQSIEQAYKDVLKYKRWLKSKEKELLKRLGAIGVNIARIEFDTTIALANAEIHARLEPVTVNSNVTDNLLVISANGKDVAFIEFGAGVKYGYGYPQTTATGKRSGRPDDVVGIGEYGEGHGNNPKGWWYSKNGESYHSYGVQPAMAMWEAEKQIIEQVTSIVREVFKS
jgi:hypothetical protein